MTRYLLKVDEAAEAIGLGRSKTYQLVNRGVLRSVRVDGSVRVPVSAVEEFVRDLEAGRPLASAA